MFLPYHLLGAQAAPVPPVCSWAEVEWVEWQETQSPVTSPDAAAECVLLAAGFAALEFSKEEGNRREEWSTNSEGLLGTARPRESAEGQREGTWGHRPPQTRDQWPRAHVIYL